MPYGIYINYCIISSFVWLFSHRRTCYCALSINCLRGTPVTDIDNLMLDAKQTILDEQHRRFHTLQQEGRWEEALHQIHVTMSCAADLLKESLRVLDESIESHNHSFDDRSGPPSPTPQ